MYAWLRDKQLEMTSFSSFRLTLSESECGGGPVVGVSRGGGRLVCERGLLLRCLPLQGAGSLGFALPGALGDLEGEWD